MRRRFLAAASLLALALVTAPPAPRAAEDTTQPDQLVDALNGLFGPQNKTRASHAKGFCAKGSFTPAPAAKDFATAATFAGGPHPALVRFSIGGGNPKASDKSRGVRGLAAKITLPKQEEHDLVFINAPVFASPTPALFLGFMQSRAPDPTTGKPNPDKVKAFDAAHPQVAANAGLLSKEPAPASYGTTRYNSLHAFGFAGPKGGTQPARMVLEPVAGVRGLTPEQEKSGPDDFLLTEFQSRLSAGPVAWDLKAIIPAPGDTLTDPSAPWTGDRKTVTLGRLAVTTMVPPGAPDDCDPQVFDPSILPAGIEPPTDPVFPLRSPAYAVSFGRRQ